MSLQLYERKRDFTKTKEPSGGRSQHARRTREGQCRFVVQKHAATQLHYDFRLEMEGSLKSWAVPKGVPRVHGEKRLAVEVEDHPVSYIAFEGTIPKGEYGGGTVMVWDHGSFEPLTQSPTTDLARGKLHFELRGEKLRGAWHLVRLRDSKNWLLIRGGPDLAGISKRDDDRSVLTGRTMAQIAGGEGKPMVSERNQRRHSGSLTKPLKTLAKSRVRSPVAFVEPMMARLVEQAPSGRGEWVYEIKFDGYRAIALVSAGEARIYSRNELDLGGKFPEVVKAVAQLSVQDVILDGEIVALDDQGRSSFQLLQARERSQGRPPIRFYVFDLLRLDGVELHHLPLVERKARLEHLLKSAPETVRFSASLGRDPVPLLEQIERWGLEGLIGKRADSPYEPGRRTGSWVKLRVQNQQEMVIGGYTDPAGARQGFGALLVGFYENQRLRFAGKVGSGFDEGQLRQLRTQLSGLARERCPFTDQAALAGTGLSGAELRRCHWVDPQLVCQVRFSEWTRDRKLRHPVFLGLRPDKDARQVIAERA